MPDASPPISNIEILATANPVEKGPSWLQTFWPDVPLNWPEDPSEGAGLHASDRIRGAGLEASLKRASNRSLLVAGRGGYGSFRALKSLLHSRGMPLSREGIRGLGFCSNARFLGFSDLSIFLNLGHELGLRAWHGPMALWPESLPEDGFFHPSHLFSPYELPMNPQDTFLLEGEIFGGNLTVFLSLSGCGLEPDWRGKILFLEDVGERTYRLDRMLQQILAHRDYRYLQAVILGSFHDCEAQEGGGFQASLQEIQAEFQKSSPVPVYLNCPVGHISKTGALPFCQPTRLFKEQGENLKVELLSF